MDNGKLIKIFSLIAIILLVIYFALQFRGENKSGAKGNFEEGYYAGIEVGSTGPRGIILKISRNEKGELEYRRSHKLKYIKSPTNYTDDKVLVSDEINSILTQIEGLDEQIEEYFEPVKKIYLVLSIGYSNVEGKDSLVSKISNQFPNYLFDSMTTELEARSSFYTMKNRIGISIDDAILLDIGGSSSIFSFFDYPRVKICYAEKIEYGSTSILKRIDPDLELSIINSSDRKVLSSETNNLMALPIKRILTKNNFSKRKNVILVGGLGYQIAKLLKKDFQEPLVNISLNSNTSDLKKVEDLIISNPQSVSDDLIMRLEELYAAMNILKITSRELNQLQSMYFFEQESWMPGYILIKLGYN